MNYLSNLSCVYYDENIMNDIYLFATNYIQLKKAFINNYADGGSHKRYIDCHMLYDYTKRNKCTMADTEKFIKNNILFLTNLWEKSIFLPQQYSINLLSSNLL